MVQVKLRKDFYGTLIPKVSSDSLKIIIDFKYKGPAQTLRTEVNTGKKGIWFYDQESPRYFINTPVYTSDSFRTYSYSTTIPLDFWGDRQIDNGAVEIVIKGEGIYSDAVLWDAYTMNMEFHLITVASPSYRGKVVRFPDKATYSLGEVVKLTATPSPGNRFTYWDVDGEWLDTRNPINFAVFADHTVTAHFTAA